MDRKSSVTGPAIPRTSYVICATPRCGSNLLCEALWRTGLSGRPDEHFLYWHMEANEPKRLESDYARPWLLPADEYMRKVIREGSSGNGIFGTKIMSTYFDVIMKKLDLLPSCRNLPPAGKLEAVFPNLRYILMTRSDKVRQAVSMAKAIQSRKWIDVEDWVFRERSEFFFTRNMGRLESHLRNASQDGLTYDFEQINQIYGMLQEQERRWEDFLEDVPAGVFRVVYEEFADSYDQTTRNILDFLGISWPNETVLQKRALKRQSDDINDEWSRLFRVDKESEILGQE